jgi:hypothetical protein
VLRLSQQTLKSTQYDFTSPTLFPVYWNAQPHPLPGPPQNWKLFFEQLKPCPGLQGAG